MTVFTMVTDAKKPSALPFRVVRVALPPLGLSLTRCALLT